MFPLLILLGHGFKPFGHALLDEIFPFFLKIKKPNFSDLRSLLIIWISVLILIFTISALITDETSYLYKFHLLWIAICICWITCLKKINFFDYKAIIASKIYLGINLIFVIIQQINFFISGGQYKCAELIEVPCFIDYVFWQHFWTGTAYSSIGLFISSLILIETSTTFKAKFIYLLIFALISVLQESKLALIFVFLIFTLFISTSTKKYILYLILSICFILVCDIFFSLLNNNFFFKSPLALEILIKNTFSFALIFKPIYQNDFLSFLDEGRLNQIINIFKYSMNIDFQNLFFGNFTGFHRHQLIEYIPYDSSGILRPIGIVVLISDWGLVFIFSLLVIIGYNFFKFIRYIREKVISSNKIIFFVLSYFSIILCVFITNLNDSMLFWYVVFFPDKTLLYSTKKLMN